MCLRLEEGIVMQFYHIQSPKDLVTPYENTRASFLQMALEKNIRATPFVAKAKDLRARLQEIASVEKLLQAKGIYGALLTAAGISIKATAHIDDLGKTKAIENLIENFLIPQGKDFRDELVYRFLLTSGDSLGGSMRNIIGILAQRKLVHAIIARLDNANKPYRIEIDKKIINHTHITNNEKLFAEYIKAIEWYNERGVRSIIFNITVPQVKKNVDMCIFNIEVQHIRANIQNEKVYVCLGELKGGADPAGADEHWKTARSALQRVYTAFETTHCNILSCFIGAAIADAMAEEIWEMLVSKKLSFAANLTVDDHVAAFTNWLISI